MAHENTIYDGAVTTAGGPVTQKLSRGNKGADLTMKAAAGLNINATYRIRQQKSPNTVLNGRFDTDTIWTKGTGWTISGGVATSDASQTGDSDLENVGNAPVAGKKYRVEFTVSGYVAGNVTPVVGNQEGTDRSANGTYSEVITATNTDVLKIRADLDFDGSVDNVRMWEEPNPIDVTWNPGQISDGAIDTALIEGEAERITITGDGDYNIQERF